MRLGAGLAVFGIAAAALLAGIGDARADAIDGSWCFRDGRTFSIRGPQIVTPGGKRLSGDYDRHGFSYVIPSPERNAGATAVMSLIDDDTIELSIATGTARGPIETWRRCSGVIS